MQGVTTQVYSQKRSTAWTTTLKKKPVTCGAAHSLTRMRNTLIQNFLAWYKLFTTSGQSSSAVDITHPRYLKEVTISRGRP